MGLDCSAQIILGVSLEEKTTTVLKTKYDQDTGKPYEVEEDKSFFVIRGTDISVPINDYDDYEMDKFFHYCDYEDKNSWFFGISICETNSLWSSKYWWAEVPNKIPEEKLNDLIKKLEAIGFNGHLKYYLLQILSY